MAEFVPYPMMPPAPAREFRKTTPGVEYGVLNPAQKTNLAENDALTQQQMDDITGPGRQLRDQRAGLDAQAAAEQAAEAARIAQEREQADQRTAADLSTWKNRLEGAYKDAQTVPSPRLFADGSTAENVLRGVGLALAGLGDGIRDASAARQGRGPGPSTFFRLIDMDLQRQREHIGKLKDNVLMARTGAQDAQTARGIALAEIDAKGAGIMKRLEGVAKARLGQLNRGALAGDVEQNAVLREIQAKRLEYKKSSLQGLHERHATPTTESITRDVTSNMPKPPTPGAEDVKEANRLEADIQAQKNALALIEKDPKAWDEFRNNTEAWQRKQAPDKATVMKEVRALGQWAGLADVAPEQGLNSTSGKELHQYMTQINTGIAKGYGGVITEGDRDAAGSEQANLSQSAQEKIPGLKRLIARNEAALQAYHANRGVMQRQPAAASPTGPQPVAPTGPTGPQTMVPASTPTATPSKPIPQVRNAQAKSARETWIEAFKQRPSIRNTDGGRAAMQTHNITEADLR